MKNIKGHRYRDPRDKESEPHPNPIKKHMRINPHTNKPFKKDDRSPLIPTSDGKDYQSSTHNYWKFFVHYKKGKRNSDLYSVKIVANDHVEQHKELTNN